jgi:CubicO group peptidase (beta-lactamase class C family)
MYLRLSGPFVGLVASLSLAGPIAGVQAQEELRVGRTLSGTLASGDTASYTLNAPEDFFVFAEVDQLSVDVVVRVLDAEGKQRIRVHGPGPARGPERFNFETTGDGPFTVQVIPFEEEIGGFTITLLRLEEVETDPKKLADQLMAPYDLDDTPGGVIHVWKDGRTLYSKGYGMANLAYGITFEPETRTNIGSTSKQFTAFAVMLQADRGHLSLDDDIRIHVPELPEFGEVITVRHLITHTSGLREFLNLLSMSGRRLDHGDWIDRSELIDIVQRQPKLQNSPGAEWNYNNTAFGLAALIVERTSGQDFHVFMQESVFAPLGMTETAVRPSPEHIIENRSEGYAPSSDGFIETGDLGGAVGAGAIYTTVADLQTWVENYATPRVGNVDIFEQMMTSYVLTDGEETGYGYGLQVDEQRGLRRIHHGGADVAHRSMLAYYPSINAGITAQSNHAGFDSNVAFRIASAFFVDDMEADDQGSEAAATESFDATSYEPERFDEVAGQYAMDADPAFILTLSQEDETFYVQAPGRESIEIVPTSDSTFTLTLVEASVVFHRNADGQVDALTLNQNGQQRATRLMDAWDPDEKTLITFVGRYFSEELETFYDVDLVDGSLVLTQRRLDDAPLTAGAEDEFSGGGLSLSFERDRNGVVMGFYVANGRTRDVRFERMR